MLRFGESVLTAAKHLGGVFGESVVTTAKCVGVVWKFSESVVQKVCVE